MKISYLLILCLLISLTLSLVNAGGWKTYEKKMKKYHKKMKKMGKKEKPEPAKEMEHGGWGGYSGMGYGRRRRRSFSEIDYN